VIQIVAPSGISVAMMNAAISFARRLCID